MLSCNDFDKKQLVFVFAREGEKIAFKNENLVVKKEYFDEKTNKEKSDIIFQVSLYKLFMVYVIGDLSITTVFIKKAQKYNFFIALMSPSFRLYELIGSKKEGNTLLHEKQYKYADLKIAKHIVKNKILNQKAVIMNRRNKDDIDKICINELKEYLNNVEKTDDLYYLLSIEGNASKIYFKTFFRSIDWKGRKPRVKSDIINSTLDIAYTLLFTFIDSIVSCFGFDTYCGVYHKQFYMRKSLICDLIEPFRCLMEKQVLKSYNLMQIQEDDFVVVNHQYKLSWEKSKDYVTFLMQPLLENKNKIFMYIQSYYRAFMKERNISNYPIFEV